MSVSESLAALKVAALAAEAARIRSEEAWAAHLSAKKASEAATEAFYEAHNALIAAIYAEAEEA